MLKIALLILTSSNLELNESCDAIRNIYEKSYELAKAKYPIEDNLEDASSQYTGSLDGWNLLKYTIIKSYIDYDKGISKKIGASKIKKTCMSNFSIEESNPNFNPNKPYITL